MKSWRTTASSIFTAIGYWASLQPDPWWMHKAGEACVVIGLALIGAVARDNGVPSADVPKAAARDEQLKRETDFIPRP